MKLTARHARELFHYNARTGIVTWKISISNRAPVGTAITAVHSTGSIHVGIYGRRYKLHRVIWFIKTGRWPKCEIDHKNCVRHDNRWRNLREATSSQNKINKRVPPSKSGYRGVIRTNKNSGGWAARIKLNYQQKYLGTFDTPKAAYAVYCKAAKATFGEFARF